MASVFRPTVATGQTPFGTSGGFDSVQSLSCQSPATSCCNSHIQLRYGAASSEMRVVIVFLVLQPPYGAVAAGKLKQDAAGRGTAGEEDWPYL